MSLESTLMAGRAAAERVMTDSCRVTRGTGSETFNEVTGLGEESPALVVYTGSCRLKGTGSTRADVAGHVFVMNVPEIHLPVTTPVQIGDKVEILSSFDVRNIGRVFSITDVSPESHATALRLPLQEVAR